MKLTESKNSLLQAMCQSKVIHSYYCFGATSFAFAFCKSLWSIFMLLDSSEVVSELTYWKTHWWYLYQLMVFCLAAQRAGLIFLMHTVPCYPFFCIKYLCFLSYFSISKCIRGCLITSVHSQCCWFTNSACFKSLVFC